MTSFQYEALCRHAISRLCRLPVSQIHTGHLPGSTRSPAKTRHQIDLYWTSSDGLSQFLCIANAKWRSASSNVGYCELMTLIAVQHDIGAHKAMMITNAHFSTGIITQAREKGIALLIVRPAFDFSSLISAKPSLVLNALEHRAATHPITPLFTAEIIHRAFHLSQVQAPALSGVEAPALSGVEGPASPPRPDDFAPDSFPEPTTFIESPAAPEAIENKPFDDSELLTRMIQGSPSDPPTPPPPFPLQTK